MRLPGDDERLAVYGMTGSGKTVAAVWHLSQRNFLRAPWLIFDTKGDKLIGKIPHAQVIKVGEVPKRPGIYITRPFPKTDDNAVEDSMYKILEREDIGVFVDEGYMISNKNAAFDALLTQGRSKHIPMITLSQRPVWMTRFVISEASFHQVFFLSDESDRDVVQRFIPYDIKERRLPKYHSYYYDVADDEFTGLKPVPAPKEIMGIFEQKLRRVPRIL